MTRQHRRACSGGSGIERARVLSLGGHEQCNDVDLHGAAFAHGVDPFVGLAFEVHLREFKAQHAGDVGTHLVFHRAELGFLEYDGTVEIADAKARGLHAFGGFREEDLAVLAFVAGVGVGKELADVGLGEGAQECVGHSGVESVAIAVGDGAAVVGKGDAAQDEGTPLACGRAWLKPMEVVAVADAGEGHGRERKGGGRGGRKG